MKLETIAKCFYVVCNSVLNDVYILFHSDLDLTKSRLFWILQVLIDPTTESTVWSLHVSLESLSFTLCRLPIIHMFVMTPPALIGEGTVSEKVLDKALMESEVSGVST